MQNKGSLHNKFERFGAAPSDKLWDSIASNLDQKKKRRAMFWWWFGSGLFAATTLVAGFNLYQSNDYLSAVIKGHDLKLKDNFENKNDILEHASNIINQQVIDSSILNKNKSKPKKINDFSALITQHDKKSFVKTNLNATVKGKTKKDWRIAHPEQINNSNAIVKADENKMSITKLKLPLVTNLPQIKSTHISNNKKIENLKTKSKWTYSLFVQNHFSLPNKNYEINALDNQESLLNNNENNVEAFNINSLSNVTKRMPSLRFGLSKKLSTRFKFQTGLDLGGVRTKVLGYPSSSYLNSTIFTIGVPVKINFAVILKKRFNLYTDFGLVNDLPIFQFSRTFNLNQPISSELSFVTGFMGGVELGLGANYKLNENFKLGLRTGYKHYYFQSFKNVYPQQKLNRFVTFDVGLIWNW